MVNHLKATHVILEGDSTIVVRWLSAQFTTKICLYPLLTNYWRLMAQFYKVKHIYREANSTADWMVIYIANYMRSIL